MKLKQKYINKLRGFVYCKERGIKSKTRNTSPRLHDVISQNTVSYMSAVRAFSGINSCTDIRTNRIDIGRTAAVPNISNTL